MIDRETEGGRGRDRAKEWDSRMGESPMREGGRGGGIGNRCSLFLQQNS